ncbi:VWA-like domain-containing protein [Clostridium sardiniense]|uniref:vWA domain-containing protein n=1 Tax=Clostridium sardiniense TaxID=29369 RepID=UPI00195CF883|nr:VWA-like domain-containing protein [Clostridium sardiniense]MBM7833109.1 putative metal-dependent peptidase [Clostridium sardiniense]
MAVAFEDKRSLLLKEALNFQDINDVSAKFKREFLNLVEGIIIDQIEIEEGFFGNFMLKVDREIKLDISWPLATIPTIDGFKMYFNPILFLNSSKREMGALFKHEIYHIMFNHYEREKELKNSYSKEAVSVAMDISINQFIKHLPMECKRIDSVKMEYNINLKDEMTVEYYAKEIDEAIKKREEKNKNKKKKNESDKIKREYDTESAHDVWENLEMDKDRVKELTKKTAISSIKGDTPKNILDIVAKYKEKEEINWQEFLKRILPTVKSGYKKTIVRRDRRQPDRVDLRGALRDTIPELIVAIDISASMSEDDVRKIMVEVLAITRSRVDKIKVIECDDMIRRVYDIRTPRDIKERSSKNGATKFSPVFEYIKDNRLSDRVLIYFTDGIGEEKLTVKPTLKNVIWVLTGEGKLSLKEKFGVIKHIKVKKKVGEGGSAAIEMMREVGHEWHR